jgi:predicted ATPase
MKKASRTNLHDVGTSFVGRAGDVAALGARFDGGARLVTVTGPGGMGKTRLAIRFADTMVGAYSAHGGGGVWFCDLIDARSAMGMTAIVASTLGIRLDQQAGEAAAARELARAIGRRGRMLLVLDNLEHLLSEGTTLVEQWLAAAPRTQLLVTSRVALGLATEEVWPLSPLTPEEGAELFVERARRVRPDLATATTEREVVSDIVEELEGLPLAIELAASRMAVLSTGQLRERLRRPLDVLTTGRAGRHGSMRRTVLDSVQLLSAEERAAFVACACFRNGFTLEAAESVVLREGASPSVLPVIEALARSSLVRTQAVPALGGELRLSLFEAIREVAAELLGQDPARERLAARHAAFYAGLAERLGPEASNGDRRASRRLDLDVENLLAAHAHALATAGSDPSGPEPSAHQALVIALALEPVLSARGLTLLRVRLLDGAIRAAGAGVEVGELAAAFQARGLAERELGDMQAARASLERGLALAGEEARPALAAMAHTRIGEILDVAGATAEAHVRFARALELLRQAPEDRGRDLGEAETYLRSAHAHRREGGLARAEIAVTEAVDRYRRLGHDEGLGAALYEAAVIVMFQSRAEVAMARFDEGLTVARRADARAVVGALTTARGGLLQEQGALDDALFHHAEAARIFRELGSRYRETSALYYLATAYLERGDASEADRLLVQALERARGVGSPRYEALIESCRAVALGKLEDADAAAEAMARARRSQARCEREPALAATVAVHGFTVELCGGGPDRTGRRAPVLGEARALVAAHPSDDSRFALRVLVAQGRATPPDQRRALRIGPAGESFALPGEEGAVDLTRRGPLSRVLLLLATRRREAPGEPVPVEDVIRAGWPDERIDARSALNRAYVALATLRKLGLRGILQTTAGGYCLHPGVAVRFTATDDH